MMVIIIIINSKLKLNSMKKKREVKKKISIDGSFLEPIKSYLETGLDNFFFFFVCFRFHRFVYDLGFLCSSLLASPQTSFTSSSSSSLWMGSFFFLDLNFSLFETSCSIEPDFGTTLFDEVQLAKKKQSLIFSLSLFLFQRRDVVMLR